MDTTYTATCMSTLTRHPTLCPIVCKIHKDSNDQWDFYETVQSFIEDGYLVQDDFLILDNATVHTGKDMLPHLELLLGKVGIHLRYLPKYSPELNPIELIFAQLKRILKTSKSHEFLADILYAFACVNWEHVFKAYQHCIEGIFDPSCNHFAHILSTRFHWLCYDLLIFRIPIYY